MHLALADILIALEALGGDRYAGFGLEGLSQAGWAGGALKGIGAGGARRGMGAGTGGWVGWGGNLRRAGFQIDRSLAQSWPK